MYKTNFDQDGYPCPPLLEPLTLSELECRHVQEHPNSTTRASIFTGYLEYLEDFQSAIGVGFKQWVNGSFTTQKLDPDDVDIISFVPHTVITNSAQFTAFQTNGGSRDRYRVDAYLIPVYPAHTIEYMTVTLLIANAWAGDFGFDRETGQEKNVAQLLFP
ncbi:MAG: hypothetical protein EOO61_03330 [Hymenobacter sp.]|nr:MAG: hypothetical protein EOO61_03330 [Hymenobacter sp.]